MSLKHKIFHFGINGRQISELTSTELEEAKEQEWVEFLSPKDLQNFKKSFSLIPITTYKNTKNIPNDCFVRMNLQSWRAYLFGSDFITKSPLYFFITDYLIYNPGFVPVSILRSKFKIDPKTMHYLCKKLKEKDLIIEKKRSKDTEIKLVEINDKSKEDNTTCSNSEKEEIVGDVTKFIYFNNISFSDQIKYHVNKAKNGIGSKELFTICGMKSKVALKNMQKLCSMYAENYKLVSSIEQKHTAFKVFNLETLNERNRRKIVSMSSNIKKEQDLLLSSKDRQEVLKILAQKYRHFKLTKDIITEIAEMTGYPYEIDRKNLIKNAKEAGLKLFKLPEVQGFRFLIALPEYDESIISGYLKSPNIKPLDVNFFKALRHFYLYSERFIVKDNGYCYSSEMSCHILLDFITWKFKEMTSKSCLNSDISLNERKMHFDFNLIGDMPVGIFYKIIKVKKLLFKLKCAFDIYKAVVGKSLLPPSVDIKLKSLKIDSFYIGICDSKKVSPDIYEVSKALDTIELKNYINFLPVEFQDYLRLASRPFKFIRHFNRLKSLKLLNYETDDLQKIIVIFNENYKENTKQYPCTSNILNYNTRIDFINYLRLSSKTSFHEDAKIAISKIPSRSDQRLLLESIDCFLKPASQDSKEKSNIVDVPESDHRLYLEIKKLVIFQIPITFNLLSDFSPNDIEDILNYMTKKHIITGHRSMASIESTVISSKLKYALQEYLPIRSTDKTRIPSDLMYFKTIYPKILNVVQTAGSIDFDQILNKTKYFEAFEIKMFFDIFSKDFVIRKVDDFLFYSYAAIEDPFA